MVPLGRGPAGLETIRYSRNKIFEIEKNWSGGGGVWIKGQREKIVLHLNMIELSMEKMKK